MGIMFAFLDRHVGGGGKAAKCIHIRDVWFGGEDHVWKIVKTDPWNVMERFDHWLDNERKLE